MPNIVQAEFFHVGGKDCESLSDVMRQCAEATRDYVEAGLNGLETIGSGIKTCVRFFDTDDSLTKLVILIQKLDEEYDEMLLNFPETGFFKRKIHSFKLSRLSKRLSREKSSLIPILADKIKGISNPGCIGIEESDHSFRHPKDLELPDVRAASKRAKNVWVFVFSPNELLAGKNEIIAHVI